MYFYLLIGLCDILSRIVVVVEAHSLHHTLAFDRRRLSRLAIEVAQPGLGSHVGSATTQYPIGIGPQQSKNA
jgi:hypothetical protein